MVTVENVTYGNESKGILTKEVLKSLFEEVLANREIQLMKPVEQQALFIAGKLSQENRELREKIELVVQENVDLWNRIKALPIPPEEVSVELERKTLELDNLKKENCELERKLQIEVECARVARESEKNLASLVREREALINELEESIKEVFLEEARARADLEEKWQNAMGELRDKLLEEKIAQEHLKAEWEKTLAALKEAQKPWWKKLFGIT